MIVDFPTSNVYYKTSFYKPAIEKHKSTDKKILVFATDLSLKEEKIRNLIAKMDASKMIDSLSLSKLVTFVEDFESNEEKMAEYIKQSLLPFNMNNYGAVVFGCTHYVTYRNIFKKILPEEVDIFDGNIATVKHLRDILEKQSLLSYSGSGEFEVYYSGKRIF